MKIIKSLASLKLLNFCLLWLMVILVIGTLEQKNIGLFSAQEKYFYSLYFKYYFLYLPGGGLTMSVFSFSLIAQLISKTQYKNLKKIGITLSHLGVLTLMIGALFTNLFGTEGSIILKEGETKDHFLDYKDYSLLFLEENSLEPAIIYRLKEIKDLDTKITIKHFYNNCELVPNNAPSSNEVGFSKMFTFINSSSQETKIKCLEFVFQDKTYRVFTDMPKNQTIKYRGKLFDVVLSNTEINLPFIIQLVDFQKEFHQGTVLSKSFKSYVKIVDKNITTDHLIEMNKPLRYGGYTFYQSSFSENSQGEYSELSVVKNQAATIPYISTIIIFLGLLIHLIINFRKYFYE